MGGMVLETNMNEIVAQVELQNRMEKSEVSSHLQSGHTGRSHSSLADTSSERTEIQYL